MAPGGWLRAGTGARGDTGRAMAGLWLLVEAQRRRLSPRDPAATGDPCHLQRAAPGFGPAGAAVTARPPATHGLGKGAKPGELNLRGEKAQKETSIMNSFPRCFAPSYPRQHQLLPHPCDSAFGVVSDSGGTTSPPRLPSHGTASQAAGSPGSCLFALRIWQCDVPFVGNPPGASERAAAWEGRAAVSQGPPWGFLHSETGRHIHVGIYLYM